ncbi:MAG: hypothetical protein K9K81_12380, partial [Desulfobacteraceae bacterium]|nr:hypothetical protein [Desulfobacteraceae bacterium]
FLRIHQMPLLKIYKPALLSSNSLKFSRKNAQCRFKSRPRPWTSLEVFPQGRSPGPNTANNFLPHAEWL